MNGKIEGGMGGGVERKENVSEAISQTVTKFKDKWPDVEVLQNGPDIITIGVKGKRMTREVEDQIYAEILGDLEEHGYKCENDNGAPGGWSGDSYGEETYEQADSWKVTKVPFLDKEPNKNASEWFAEMKDDELLDWWCQYGTGEQASYYRGVPRTTAQLEIKKRGLIEAANKKEDELRAYGRKVMKESGVKAWRMVRTSDLSKKPNLPE